MVDVYFASTRLQSFLNTEHFVWSIILDNLSIFLVSDLARMIYTPAMFTSLIQFSILVLGYLYLGLGFASNCRVDQ